MDQLDYRILSELLKNAQASFAEIARKLGTSPYTVGRRYENMKKEGMFLGSRVSIDLSKIGYQGKAFLWIAISPQQSKLSTIETLKKIRNIILVSELIGPYDLLAIAPVADLANVRTLIEEVKNAPNVQRVEVTLINDTEFPINPSFGRILSKKCEARATS
jgi:Lrp/AsnC family transcriptional regulator for asnA, asnC and gidA